MVSTFFGAYDDLLKRGKVVAGTWAEYARAGNGVAVKAGARKWDIGTAEGFKRAMLEANSIGHSSQGTGPFNTKLFQRLGIYDQLKGKIKITEGSPSRPTLPPARWRSASSRPTSSSPSRALNISGRSRAS